MTPTRLDLKRDERLRVEWPDGREDALPVTYLRRMCPCAECRMAREGRDPHKLFAPADEGGGKKVRLGVVPASKASDATVAVERAERVGSYALKLFFTDGHSAGIYSWAYLRELGGEP